MSKYAKMDGTAEFMFELREAGEPWDEDGGIVTQVHEAFPGYTTESAIPLRKIYHAHKAQVESGFKIAKSSKAITKARDAGWGWAAISVRAGISVSKAKKLYTGEHPDGRVYVDATGKLSTVLLESTAAVAEARKEITEEELAAAEALLDAMPTDDLEEMEAA